MNWKKAFAFFALALAIFMGDAVLKAYIHYNIPTIAASAPIYPFGGIGVFHNWQGIDFSIVHVINKGAAWGMFSSLQEYLLYARMAIIGGLLTYLFFVKSSPFRKFSLTLIATGAHRQCARLLCLWTCDRYVPLYFMGLSASRSSTSPIVRSFSALPF